MADSEDVRTRAAFPSRHINGRRNSSTSIPTESLMMRRLLVFLLPSLLALAACKPSVPLSSDDYPGSVSNTDQRFKGTQIYLVTPSNNANNTTLLSYRSADGNHAYGGPALTSYLWYCFEKAFTNMGIMVHDDRPPFPIPQMDLTFTSWSDQEFVGTVTLATSQNVYKLPLKVQFQPPDYEQATPEDLKAFAYYQIDEIVAHILNDPGFQQAYFAAQPAKDASVAPPSASGAPAPEAVPPTPAEQ